MKLKGEGKLRLLILASILISLLSFAGWFYLGNHGYFPKHNSFTQSQTTVPAKQSNFRTLNELGNAKLTGNLVDPDEHIGVFAPQLERMARAYHNDLGVDMQIVVANLEEDNIGSQAEKLFNLRRIGAGSRTGGILILIDPARKKTKIEVSHTLEGVLTDSRVGLIAKNQLSPYASYNALGMAIMDTLHMIKDYLYLASLQGRLFLTKDYVTSREYAEKKEILSGGAGAFADIFDMNFDHDWKKTLSIKERKKYQPASEPIESAESYLRVLRDIVGDPGLDLFTAETNYMRSVSPVAPFEYLARYRILEKSRPFRVIQEGDYAVVTSTNPAHGFMPILLKRVDKKWQIDLVELWKNLLFDGNGEYFLRNSNTPYRFGLTQFGDGKYFDVAKLGIPTKSLHEKIKALKRQESALSHFRLGEIYFRNTFTAVDALDQYDRAVKMAPNYPLFSEVLAERYIHIYFPEAAIPLLKKQGRVALLKLTEAYALANDYDNSEKTAKKVLEANPYSIYALRWLAWAKKKKKQQQEYHNIKRQITELENDPEARAKFVWLTFQPENPRFNISNTVKVDKTTVYGHSQFSIMMTNHSKRDVKINQLIFRSRGDRNTSGLGDIKGYFHYPKANNILPAGESISFNKVWGFTTPTANKNMTYDFELCWQGVKDTKQQCEVQRLNLITEDLG